mmetsp:Transcript_76605/g.112217  ORF Transcript_76605/g.112217 Transcript_76605/m.112217 type:complete len:268 (-) Transcript_76605:245-1048(-)
MAGLTGRSALCHRNGCASGVLVTAMLFAHVALTSQTAAWTASAELPRSVGVDTGGVMRLRGGKTGGIKARDIWTKPLDELSTMEDDLRLELMTLRVAKQVGGQPAKVNQIKKVRKSIARVLTVMTAKRRLDAYELVKKDKYKPLDARSNRHMTKAMRQRLNKFERTRISGKAIKCLRLKIWGGGVRPMRRLVLTSPLDDVYLGVCEPDEERTFEKYPARKRGTFGKKTHTGHMPVHAEQAREKWASRRKKESERRAAFKAKYADDSD